MIRLFRWLFGYVKFSFNKGFYEDFLTECYKKAINIYDIVLFDGGVTAYCNVKVYKKLHTIAHAHGGTVKIIKKHGLPFLLRPLKNRLGFFVGIIICMAVISFLGSFIWNVEIVGNNSVSDAAINSYLENNNLKSGVMWSSVDTAKLEWGMMSEMEDLSWVHINRLGTTARIEVNEITKKPVPNDDKLKGVNVMRKELEAVAYREQKNMKIKSTKRYKKLCFFSAEIPLYFKRETGDITKQSSKFLTVKETALPIGIYFYEEVFLSSKPKSLSDDELTKLAKQKLTYLERREFDGFEIINRKDDIALSEDRCVIKTSYIVKRK